MADFFIYKDYAGSGPFGNPELGGLQYPVTLVDPEPSNKEVIISLHEFQRGNPDGYRGVIEGYVPFFADSGPTITSLDVFNEGNPDYDHTTDYNLPVVGSPEAEAIAKARRAEREMASTPSGTVGRSSSDGI